MRINSLISKNNYLNSLLLFLGIVIITMFMLISLGKLQDNLFHSIDNNIIKHNVKMKIQFNDKNHSSDIVNYLESKNFENSQVSLAEIMYPFDNISASIHIMVNDNIYDLPFVKGKFFKVSDKNVAVIGKTLLSNTFKEDNQLYIKIYNEKYKVVGVLGRNLTSAKMDTYIYIPINSMPKVMANALVMPEQKLLNLNISNKKELPFEEFDKITKYALSLDKDIIINKEVSQSPKTIDSFVTKSKNKLTLLFKIWFMSTINIMIMSYFWINDRKKEIALRMTLGSSNIKLFTLILKQYLKISGLSFIFSLLVYSFIPKKFIKGFVITKLNVFNVLPVIFVIAITAVLTSLYATVQAMKITPAIALKK